MRYFGCSLGQYIALDVLLHPGELPSLLTRVILRVRLHTSVKTKNKIMTLTYACASTSHYLPHNLSSFWKVNSHGIGEFTNAQESILHRTSF